ncbi:MAG TPA: hypothetical protein VL832_18460 [Puia sp.]|nr:hypothetical protein [Puia sp.]
MRKIKRITHLRQEQKRLHRREEELAKILHEDWKAIRKDWQPGNLAQEVLSSAGGWIGRTLLSGILKKSRS